jgi:GNAT superfamily N-acetyltransferase
MLIRAADPGDAWSVAQVHVRAWQCAYRSLLPDAYLAALSVEERAARYTFRDPDPSQPKTIVAVEGGELRGFATTAPARDEDAAGIGELAALYVHPDYWGQGIGAALIVAARERLAAAGFQFALLWVLAGNTRAERFYLLDGWMPEGVRRSGVRGGIEVQEQRFRRAL